MSGVDDLIDPRIPIIVFGGPPGTGQTYAVKVIAAKSGRIAYELGKDKGRGKGEGLGCWGEADTSGTEKGRGKGEAEPGGKDKGRGKGEARTRGR